jgi:hypothetical protein
VPDWKVVKANWTKSIFKFAWVVFQDDRAIMLFHPDNPKLQATTDESAEDYGFSCLHDWWVVNELLLIS